jgi:hypothetical protein
MIEELFRLFKNYENYVLLAAFFLFLLVLWQSYFNIKSNYISNAKIFLFTATVNALCACASALMTKYLVLYPFEHFTGYCFNYGKAAYLPVFVAFIWITVMSGHFLSRRLFREFNYGFQRGKRFTSVLASFYLPTISGLFFMFFTDCDKSPWFGSHTYGTFGTMVFLLPNMLSFVPQVFLTTQYIDKKKKVRQQ